MKINLDQLEGIDFKYPSLDYVKNILRDALSRLKSYQYIVNKEQYIDTVYWGRNISIKKFSDILGNPLWYFSEVDSILCASYKEEPFIYENSYYYFDEKIEYAKIEFCFYKAGRRFR